MGENFKKNGPGGCCCTPAITLDLLIKGCTSPEAGVAITLTQGSSSVTATTDGAGHASFSLPATGTYSLSQSGLTAYLTNYGPVITGIVAGANSRTYSLSSDIANHYYCLGCVEPARGPFSWSMTYSLPGGGSATVSGTMPDIQTPWILLPGLSPDTYCQITYYGATMGASVSFHADGSFPTATHSAGGTVSCPSFSATYGPGGDGFIITASLHN